MTRREKRIMEADEVIKTLECALQTAKNEHRRPEIIGMIEKSFSDAQSGRLLLMLMKDEEYEDREDNPKEGTISSIAREVHQIAIEHGWWETDCTVTDFLMNCVGELAEALEAYSHKQPIIKITDTKYGTPKPEGFAVELADCIIRILDYCAAKDIDIETIIKIKNDYNKTRSWRHGGKLV